MKKNSKKQTNATKHDHPGRPRYTPVYPRTKEWTFTDWMEVNGIETNPDSAKFGKGPNCTMLTLRKNMERDMFFHKKGKRCVAANRTTANPRSIIVQVRGVTAEPNSKSGLGRRANLYALRSKGVTSKATPATSAPKATRKAKAPASTSQTPTADALDKIHAALAAPEPTPSVTVPAVTITPEVTPAPAATPEPVAETPAPAPEAAPAVPVSTLANS